MGILANTEQCNSRIVHLPHYWRVDGKSVVPSNLNEGHRHMRHCIGRTRASSITWHMKTVLKDKASGKYPGCYLYVHPVTFDMLRTIAEPTDIAPWKPANPLAMVGFDVIYDPDLEIGVFEVRKHLEGNTKHAVTMVKGKAYDE